MSAFKVTVKWGRETYKEVEVNLGEDPMVFKAQLFALTGVLPERQKVMVKGKTLGENWTNFPLTDKAMVLLMGSKEEDISKPPPPEEKVHFVEDMSERELATALEMPLGLQNLGNTCYMNATVQCLKTVPPLVESLKKFGGGVGSGEHPVAITAALRDLYSAMDQGVGLPPFILLQKLHTAFPRFAERGEGGVFQQQDANELWTEVTRMLQQKLPPQEKDKAKYDSVIDEYFGARFSIEMKCDESEAEGVVKSEEKFLQLSCFISEDTKYMNAGLMNKLVEKITKNSPTLGRDAVYTKTSRIDRLPAYLTIQMMRFFYKERAGTNAKMLRDVKFPMMLDVYDLCTKGLQEKLIPIREKFKEKEDEETAKKMALKKEKKEEAKTNAIPFSFADDPGSNNSGFYELQAVLTHKGRTSNSGHYVAWIKHKDDTWIMCDDDKVHPVTSEDVLKLSGGGDWHTAYVLLYGPRILELPEGETMEPVRCEVMESEKMATE